MLKFKIWRKKLGFLHVLEQFLDWYMKEREKATKLCIKTNTSVFKSNKQNRWIYSNMEVDVKDIKCSPKSKCEKTAFFTCFDTIFKWVYKSCYFGISLHLFYVHYLQYMP